MKIVFFGTPEFAVPSLEKLSKTKDIEILAVVSQPDKPVGRKQILTAPPIKFFAETQGLKIYQPTKINLEEGFVEEIIKLKPDFLVTVAYGQILKQHILDIAPVVNLHASLLPDYRGPAPINWMIIHGEKSCGLTTMLSDAGVDTGDILLKLSTELGPDENAQELALRLSVLGADLLLETLLDFKNIQPLKQNHATDPQKQLAPFMDKNLGLIDFANQEIVLGSANPRQKDFRVVLKNSAENIHNLVRGLQAWPGAYFIHEDQKISLLKTRISSHSIEGSPGKILAINREQGSITVATQQGSLELVQLKPEGKNQCSASDWINGRRLEVGAKL